MIDAPHPKKIEVLESPASSDDGRKCVLVVIDGKTYDGLLAVIDGSILSETHIFVPELNRTFIL